MLSLLLKPCALPSLELYWNKQKINEGNNLRCSGVSELKL